MMHKEKFIFVRTNNNSMPKIKIEIKGNKGWIITEQKLQESIVKELENICSFIPVDAHYIVNEIIKKRKANGERDPKVDVESLRTKLFNNVNYSFPAGLVSTVSSVISILEEEPEIIYNFQLNPRNDLLTILKEKSIDLWEHQQDALKIASEHPRGIFKLPTGSGKTLLGVLLWELWNRKLCVILVPNENIAKQWMMEIKEIDQQIKIGCWVGNKKNEVGIVNIMTYAMGYSLLERYDDERDKYKRGNKLIEKTKFVIVDECHHVGGGDLGKPNNLYNLLMNFKSVENIYGLSATANMRTERDNIYQTASIGELLLESSPLELIEKEILVMPKIKFLHISPVEFRRKRKDEKDTEYYREKYNRVIKFNEERNMKAIKEALKMFLYEKRQVIMFTKEISHLKELYSKFPSSNQEIKVVWSEGSDPERFDKIKGFNKGEINIFLATTKLIGEGINIPNVSAVINLLGEKSEIEIAQSIGRAMRSYKNKLDCKIIEFSDSTEPFSKNSVIRLQYYHKEGYDIDLSECEWLSRFISD